MLRTHNCGELRKSDIGHVVILCGWVQRVRNKGAIIWVDLRDRYGITQVVVEDEKLLNDVSKLGREYVISVEGVVQKRLAENSRLSTGEIEINLIKLEVLNQSLTPPFIIENDTDGGEDLRMKFRYLDLRRENIRKNIELRQLLLRETRSYLESLNFIEVETPILIKSTPEGARDFVVPSRMNKGEFYALPQSPQTFKQLLMVSGFDRYFQIVKCFRDEDLRADRQPEFTQIDCELSFVERADIIEIFGNLIKYLFKKVKGIEIDNIPIMTYDDAMKWYGSDKPDLRFGMEFVKLNDVCKGKGFGIFDDAELILGITAKGCAHYSRKQLDKLTDFVKSSKVGAKGLVYTKYNKDGTFNSSVNKFYTESDFQEWAQKMNADKGDLMLILCGDIQEVRNWMNELRLFMGNELGLRDNNDVKLLWVVDFPMFEWDNETNRYHAMHHPFTSPLIQDVEKLKVSPNHIKADAYDLVVNGVELGGGSIRIHKKKLQQDVFKILGFTEHEAKEQFGFLFQAFEYGTPPHGGIAFGFDRLCALFGGTNSIRDYIAFPKNNSGRDVMIGSPNQLNSDQLKELNINIDY